MFSLSQYPFNVNNNNWKKKKKKRRRRRRRRSIPMDINWRNNWVNFTQIHPVVIELKICHTWTTGDVLQYLNPLVSTFAQKSNKVFAAKYSWCWWLRAVKKKVVEEFPEPGSYHSARAITLSPRSCIEPETNWQPFSSKPNTVPQSHPASLVESCIVGHTSDYNSCW